MHLDGKASSYEMRFRLQMRFRLRSNGSGYRTVLSRGRVVERDPHGNATRMVGTMVDLSDRPVTAVPHGLATEDPEQPIELTRLPLHALLGVACPHAEMGGPANMAFGAEGSESAHDAHRLIGLIRDLLDMALHEGSTTR